MWVWNWVVQNKQWVFGFGIAALGALGTLLWWAIKKFWPKTDAAAAIPAASATISPVISPVITNTITLPAAPTPLPLEVVPPAPAPATKPNLSVEGIKAARVYLQLDIWTLRPKSGGWERQDRYRAILVDVSNVPTDEAHTAKAAIRAAISMDYGGRVRTYSPLPWLEEFTNLVYLETWATKTVVVAVGEDSKTGTWSFVLNHRKDHYTTNTISEMDWTNQCPIPSDLPFELLMIDMSSGAILAKFPYIWTFDAVNNWPVLKAID